ncbi:hypothetical protein R1T40_02935 [Tritonibacter scottomollicae]|uniref:DUF1127 domain-containing protein n=1 Tax=Tritonibacter scottomollicae TaxID=483013 RepID=A0ABZ0HGD4_TRISK|nr:hypothetical protein [Tritonibacter scottomollicae]WOI33719.1 hypothetical protein R1T40_02935 [Tritonibacter scottomollicae]
MMHLLNKDAAQPLSVRARPVLDRILRAIHIRKTMPVPADHDTWVQVPHDVLQRLAETSPHLLADIGIRSTDQVEATSPWQLDDGRHLMLRPPL